MSDFDTVLERLLIDREFRAALGADHATALAGYQLSADEIGLLRSQLTEDDGGDHAVEARTSKAGIIGLLSPLGELGGGGAGAEAGTGVGHAGFGALTHPTAPEAGSGAQASAHLGEALGPAVRSGLGPVANQGFGELSHQGFGAVTHQGFGEVPHEGPGPVEGGGDHTPVDYHPHIDADGDGRWDGYVAVQHSDGSVDIYADRNHDGIVDFDGHDRNADGVVESADYDENYDGVADTRMTDVNGDGWLDTRGPITPPTS